METRSLKISIAAPSHAYQYYGGGEVLLDKTAEYLKKKGIEAKLFDPWHDKVENFDIIHFFGIGYFNYEFLKTVKTRGGKLVITPIFPSLAGAGGLIRKAYHCLCFAFPVLKTPPELMRRNAAFADLILANSEIEKRDICSLLKADADKIKIVHYGADRRFLDAKPDMFRDRYKIKDYILCVARFDKKQKNQLNLIRAMRGSGIPMVFVGKPDKGMEDYYAVCKKESPEGTLFIDYLEQDSPMLGSCYAAARAFVVPSKFEYPGIAAMEAILAGCKRIAMTEIGSTKEYYKDYASYFNPYSLSDIRRIVLNAYNSEPAGDPAKEYFKNNFLWENYISDVLGAYRSIV